MLPITLCYRHHQDKISELRSSFSAQDYGQNDNCKPRTGERN